MSEKANETFAEAVADERDNIKRAAADSEELEIECVFTDEEVSSFIDRLEEAHRRDIAKRQEEGMSKVPLVRIIECVVAGDRDKAVAYSEHLIKNCERKFARTNDLFDRNDIMTARNILHTLKGEPKEGGVAVMDGGAK